jgi:aspartyl protease family protein
MPSAKNSIVFGLASLCAITAAQAREFMIFDGNKYDTKQIDLATRSPYNMPQVKIGRNEVVIPRSPDGHYYVNGTVNGLPITFMVDTGASYTALPSRMARNAGVRAGLVTTASTAGGQVRSGLTKSNTITIGPLEDVEATVGFVERLETGALLGAEFLNKYVVTNANGFLTIKK